MSRRHHSVPGEINCVFAQVCISNFFFFSVGTVVFLFMVLKNNRIGCARGPMDHSELADLFIILRPLCAQVCLAALSVGSYCRCELLSRLCKQLHLTWCALQTGAPKGLTLFRWACVIIVKSSPSHMILEDQQNIPASPDLILLVS